MDSCPAPVPIGRRGELFSQMYLPFWKEANNTVWPGNGQFELAESNDRVNDLAERKHLKRLLQSKNKKSIFNTHCA